MNEPGQNPQRGFSFRQGPLAGAMRSRARCWRQAGFAAFVRHIMSLRLVRFGIVGLCATMAYYLLGLLFVPVFGLPVLAGNSLAYALSFIISYLGQACWTFGANGSHWSQLPRFAATQGVGLLLNSGIVEICTRIGLSYELAMIPAIVLVPVMVYIICRLWVFHSAKGG